MGSQIGARPAGLETDNAGDPQGRIILCPKVFCLILYCEGPRRPSIRSRYAYECYRNFSGLSYTQILILTVGNFPVRLMLPRGTI